MIRTKTNRTFDSENKVLEFDPEFDGIPSVFTIDDSDNIIIDSDSDGDDLVVEDSWYQGDVSLLRPIGLSTTKYRELEQNAEYDVTFSDEEDTYSSSRDFEYAHGFGGYEGDDEYLPGSLSMLSLYSLEEDEREKEFGYDGDDEISLSDFEEDYDEMDEYDVKDGYIGDDDLSEWDDDVEWSEDEHISFKGYVGGDELSTEDSEENYEPLLDEETDEDLEESNYDSAQEDESSEHVQDESTNTDAEEKNVNNDQRKTIPVQVEDNVSFYFFL